MNILKRIKNLWFFSGISPEDIKANPHSFIQRHANAEEMQGQAYIAGYSEEEENFANSLNRDGKDSKLT